LGFTGRSVEYQRWPRAKRGERKVEPECAVGMICVGFSLSSVCCKYGRGGFYSHGSQITVQALFMDIIGAAGLYARHSITKIKGIIHDQQHPVSREFHLGGGNRIVSN
jgi:hypothetical protein